MDLNQFLPYAKPCISQEDIEQVSRSLKTPIITRGPIVEAFEQAVADYCGAKYGVAFTSASAALTAAYHAAGVTSSDRVVTTPNSFVASIGPGVLQNATPVFIDINRQTGNLDLSYLALNLNRPATRGKTIIVPVHFSGIPVDVEAINKMINNPDTVIIEDAAHALGSSYRNGKPVGSSLWSDMTIFSFHPAKTITTGEGGMVMTNSDDLCHRLKRFRNNGIEKEPPYITGEPSPWYYEVAELTGNYNFTEMQAALGLSQLKRLDQFVSQRQKLMRRYRKNLDGIENVRLLLPEYEMHIAPHLCVVQIDFKAKKTTRTEVMNKLKELGIGTQVHYIPLYRHPFFTKNSGDISEYFPEMEAYYAKCLSLPLFYEMTEADVDRVTEGLKKTL